MTWEVGDLAACVDASYNVNADTPSLLEEGRTYMVSRIVFGLTGLGLIVDFMSVPRPFIGWRAERFRKVVPDKLEICEPEFVTLLKRTKKRIEA